MTLSLDRVAEDFFVALFRANDRLKGKKIFRHDEDPEAVNDCIIVQATVGNNRLDGDKGYDVAVEVRYRGGPKTKSPQSDVVAAEIVNSVYKWPLDNPEAARLMAEEAGFKFLIVEPEMTGNRQETHSLRIRSHTFPIICDLP